MVFWYKYHKQTRWFRRLALQSVPQSRYSDSSNKLFRLIDDEKWKAVILSVTSEPDLAKVKGDGDELPLHRACIKCASLDVIQALLKAYPEAAREKNTRNSYALHLCLQEGGPTTYAVFDEVLKAYPAAAGMKDSWKQLPIHLVPYLDIDKSCARVMDEISNIITSLIRVYPEGARAAWYLEDALPLYKFSGFDIGPQPIKALVEAYPEAAKIMHCDELPLHRACNPDELEINHRSKYEIIKVLVEAYPEGARITDEFGRIPLHSVCQSARNSLKSTEIILSAYPEGAKASDRYGLLPVHHACLNDELSDLNEKTHIIRLLLTSFPEAAYAPIEKEPELNKKYCKMVMNIKRKMEIETKKQEKTNTREKKKTEKSEKSEGSQKKGEEELWDLKAVLSITDIAKAHARPCSNKDCNLIACSIWASNLNPESPWYSCLDCQQKDFGGWPEEEEELPLKVMPKQLRKVILEKCTKQDDPVMPTFGRGKSTKSNSNVINNLDNAEAQINETDAEASIKIEMLEEQLRTAKASINSLSFKVSELTGEKKAWVNEKKTMEVSMQSVETELKNTKATNLNLNAQNADRLALVDSLTSERDRLQNDNRNLVSIKLEQEDELEKIEREFQIKTTKNENLAIVDNPYESLKTTNNQLVAENQKLKEEVIRFKNLLEESKGINKKIEKKKKDLVASNEMAETNLNQIRDDCRNLQTQNNDLTSQIQKLTSEANEIQQKNKKTVRALTDAYNTIDDQNSNLSAKMNELEEENFRLKSEIGKRKRKSPE